ncbi:MAG TPA: hypothetical protein VGR53_03430 [Nitrososphaerales archaeon]|nr:hypothetical protein [Nitrososphaerales archaeon]
MGIRANTKNGSQRSFSYLYWGWIRHIAEEEGVELAKNDADTLSLTEEQTKKLGSAIRARAEKVRKGLAPRDAKSYVDKIDDRFFSREQTQDEGKSIAVDFDNPDSMDDTAKFFELSRGVTLTY